MLSIFVLIFHLQSVSTWSEKDFANVQKNSSFCLEDIIKMRFNSILPRIRSSDLSSVKPVNENCGKRTAGVFYVNTALEIEPMFHVCLLSFYFFSFCLDKSINNLLIVDNIHFQTFCKSFASFTFP
jgi:hypothetical protein